MWSGCTSSGLVVCRRRREYLVDMDLLVVLISGMAFVNVVFVAGQRMFVPAPVALPWNGAIKYCEEQNTILAVVETMERNDMLSIKARQLAYIDRDESWNRIWIRGYRNDRSHKFLMDKETPMKFINFDSENKVNLQERCIEIHLRNNNTFAPNWATDDCAVEKRFFCMHL